MSKSKAKILSLPITNHANYNAEKERQENVIGGRIDEARRKAGLSLVDFSALLRSRTASQAACAGNHTDHLWLRLILP